MDIQNQHPDKEGTALPPAQRDGAPANPGRRRFTRAGIGASGVILTLASDPALATGTTTPFMCRSPSGSLSGGLQSQPGTQTVVCNGVSPGYWKNHSGAWVGCYPTKTRAHAATTFASVFPFGSTTLYQTGTMMAVLTNNDPNQDPYNLGMHLVSAYLNVLSGKINYFTVTVLKTMWHDLVTYGYYAPTAGTKWYAYDIKKYLESTEH